MPRQQPRRTRLPRARRDRVLEAARACREACHRATERLPAADPAFARLYAVAAEIDALAAELTGPAQPVQRHPAVALPLTRRMSRASVTPRRRLAVLAGLAPLLLSPVAPAFASAAPACGWREPPRSYPEGARWRCAAVDWADGDTLTAKCGGGAGTVVVRVRRVDTAERGEAGWREARGELRRRTEGRPLDVLPRHRSRRRVVADVLAGGENVGAAMDAAGWSKPACPKR